MDKFETRDSGRERTVPGNEEVTAWLHECSKGGSESANAMQIDLEACSSNPSSTTWIFKVSSAEEQSRIFVKHHRDQLMFDREQKVLQLLRPFAGPEEPYGVPEILASSGSLGVIALRWIEGTPVGGELRKAAGWNSGELDLQSGRDCSYHVGRWLRCFEDRTDTGQKDGFPLGQILNRVRELCECIVDHAPGLFDRQFALAVESELESTAAGLDKSYQCCMNHRDFSFGHIWRRSAGIVVIDYGRCKEQPNGRDAAQFILRLEDLGSFNPMVSSGKVTALQSAFVEGYGRGMMDVDAPHFIVYLVLCKLEQLAGLVEKRQRSWYTRSVAFVQARAHFRWLRRWVQRRPVLSLARERGGS